MVSPCALTVVEVFSMPEPSTADHRRFAKSVESRREWLGISKSEAAKRAGISRSAWHAIEAGTTQHPQTRTLPRIDAALEAQRGTARRIQLEEIESWDEGARWDMGAAWDSVGSSWVAEVKTTVSAVEADRGKLMQLAVTMSAEHLRQVLDFATAVTAS